LRIKDCFAKDRLISPKEILLVLSSLLLLAEACLGTGFRRDWCTLYGSAPPPQIDSLIAFRYEVVAEGHTSTLNLIKRINPKIKWMFYNSVSDNYTSGLGIEEHEFLIAKCHQRGADPESLYYHYWDDTIIELQGQQISIPGWGGGSASQESEARVPVYYADLSRRAVDLNNRFTRQLEKEYNLEKFKTLPEGSQVGYHDGIFLDNSTYRFYNYGSLLSGGRIAEHPTHAQVNEEAFQGWYWQGLKRFLQEVKDTLRFSPSWSPDGKQKFSCINSSRTWIDEYATDEVADMLLMEFQYSPIKSPESINTLAEAFRRDSLSAANGVCQLYSPSVVTELSGYYGQFSWGDALLGNLAYFYIGRSDSSYLYIDFNYSYSPSYPGWDTLTWHRCMEYDLGQPTERYRVYKTGTDGRGYQYRVYARRYERALILCRPRGSWNQHFDERTRIGVDLPMNFRTLLPNGNLGPPSSRVYLRNGEGAILIPAGFGNYVEGEVWGSWTTSGNPYNVVGELRVPPGSTLVIDPGVTVKFQGHYKFVVDSAATLSAVGTKENPILFIAADTAAGWHGLRLLSASPECRISHCQLQNGKANGSEEDAKGGALYCWCSDPVISENTISGNAAQLDGGAIYCANSSPTIENNIIKDNRSVAGGGGIDCCRSDPRVFKNSISGNSGGSCGGGIRCGDDSAPLIVDNTIAANSAEDKGGGIYCDQSSPTIINTIFWANNAREGPQIAAFGGRQPTVRYCDVQGGWVGQGNIDADPIFVSLHRHDFQLRWRSPCIDAGEPSLTDPDGTRSDIGASPFNQAVSGIIELYPHQTPIVIPPQGGELLFDGWIFNFSGYPGEADIWTYVFIPDIGQYGPLRVLRGLDIPADSIGVNGLEQSVPGLAPAGNYAFAACVGTYPDTVIDVSYFYFTKTGNSAGEMTGWEEGDWFEGATSKDGTLPEAYSLSQNFPNPFNATTEIRYQLPTASRVRLEVFNLLGERVATLVDEEQKAGCRSVTWDGSGLSSGLYLYRLTAGEFADRKKMLLLK
jgi:predicted outer membrane repeat protein